MMLARLLDPDDFGIVGMVTAITGFLELLKNFGLSTATVQTASITDEQISSLFWVNMLVGITLSVGLMASSPLISIFYHEPRLTSVSVVMAFGFIFNAAGVQHGALLQRQMRFVSLSIVEMVSLVGSMAIGIGMGFGGLGYWALVGMTLTYPALFSICVWILAEWSPSLPSKRSKIRDLLQFGGTITLVGIVSYIAYNLEKILLGRFWGAAAIGLYGRAYQLITTPSDIIISVPSGVAISALSRVQDDPIKLKNYFIKGYSIVIAVALPATIICAFYAHEIILIILGAKWKDAEPLFCILSPTILAFSMINPMTWLLYSTGLVERSLKISIALALLMIFASILGIPYGPLGVAFAFATTISLWTIPHIIWCLYGMPISFYDLAETMKKPLYSCVAASIFTYGFQIYFKQILNPLLYLIIGVMLFSFSYIIILLFILKQKEFYLDIFSAMNRNYKLKIDNNMKHTY